MADLTPAEQAIADKIMCDMDPALEPGDTSMRRHWRQHAETMAREAVTAARPAIYREAAEAMRDSEYLRDETDGHMGDIIVAADWLERRADEMGDNHV